MQIHDDDALLRGSFSLGAFEILVCSDGPFRLDGGAMFGVVPKPLWSRRIPADDQNRIQLGLNSLVVRARDAVIVIETGIGPKQPAKMKPILDLHERLPHSYRAAGVRPAEVTHVINTHLHFDHCGWNTRIADETEAEPGKIIPTFPNAQYFVAAGELAHGRLQLERDAVSYLSANYDPILERGQMTLIDLASEFADNDPRLQLPPHALCPIQRTPQLAPGVWVERLPGHTASMLGVHIESAGQHLCFVGDLFPTHHHLDPAWVMGYDLDPLTSIAQKKSFLTRAIEGQWQIAFPHDHELPVTKLCWDEKGKPVVSDQ